MECLLLGDILYCFFFRRSFRMCIVCSCCRQCAKKRYPSFGIFLPAYARSQMNRPEQNKRSEKACFAGRLQVAVQNGALRTTQTCLLGAAMSSLQLADPWDEARAYRGFFGHLIFRTSLRVALSRTLSLSLSPSLSVSNFL